MCRDLPLTASSVRTIEFRPIVFVVLLVLHGLTFFYAKEVRITNILGYDPLDLVDRPRRVVLQNIFRLGIG